MAPAAVTELAPATSCRTCGQALAPGAAVCVACGAAHGESNRCPHCNAVADVEAHAALGFRCLVCGGPRLALDVAGVTPSARTSAALEAAGREQTKHVMFSGAGLLLTGMGLLAVLITSGVLLATSPGLGASLAAYLGAAVPLGAGLLALARAAAARRLRGQALHTARVSALGDVQAVTGQLDARRVTEIMRLVPEQAELLLAEASVAALLEEAPAPRLRVGDAPATVVSADPSREPTHTELDEPRGRTTRGDTEI